MPRILLVEDDAFIVEIYLKKFRDAGFEVENALTGRDALKHLSEKGYDLVLLDLVLPEMSGFDVLREYRGKPAEYPQQSKVVIFSNLNSPSDREQATAAGADGFLSKTDFTPTQVVTEVNRLLEQFASGKTVKSEVTESTDMVKGPTSADASLDAATPEIPTTSSKKRILLIEDEDVFADMFEKRLSDEGFAVTREINGKTAVDVALQGNFDLIITDAALPGLDGREIVRQLREAEATRSTPIFLLSASLEGAEMTAIEKSGLVQAVMSKTKITPSELAQAVNEVFVQGKESV